MASFIIQLQQMRFFAQHGMYDEERKVGNEFEVNISLWAKAPKEKITAISDTINYAEVHRFTKEIFDKRKLLLETLSMEIAEELKLQFPALTKISIQICKLNPPITGFTGKVCVTYQRKYK